MILTTSLLVVILGGTGTLALPVSRSQRDAQVFTEALGPWVTECQAQSGGQYCVELAYQGVRALGPKAAVCAQQDLADTMISFAGKLANNTALISLTTTYAQQARSSSDGLAVLYCQDTPAATQLRGIYPCQSADYDLTKFTGGVAIGSAGTIPFGLTTAVTPAGSCPDHPGPIPSGEFITDSASKAASKAASSKAKSKSTGKQMTLIHPFTKRDEEGGETISEEGSTEEAPPSEDSAEPPADDSNPDATSTESSEPQPTDAPPENAAENPTPTETTSASTPSSSPSATPTTTDPAQPPIIGIVPGSPQATAMSQALVSMTNALASASNAISQAVCGISEAAKAIAKVAAALVQQPNPAQPPAPNPSQPSPESSSAPSPTSTEGPAPTDAPPKSGEGDANAPAPTGAPNEANPSSTEGAEQTTSTSDGETPSPTTDGEGESPDSASSGQPPSSSSGPRDIDTSASEQTQEEHSQNPPSKGTGETEEEETREETNEQNGDQDPEPTTSSSDSDSEPSETNSSSQPTPSNDQQQPSSEPDPNSSDSDQNPNHDRQPAASNSDPNSNENQNLDTTQEAQQPSPSNGSAAPTPGDSCTHGDQACMNEGFAQCVWGKWTITPCGSGTKCFALAPAGKPAVLACTTDEDAATRLSSPQ